MIETERLLTLRVEGCNQKLIPLSTDDIIAIVMSLFSAITEKNETYNEEFKANNGWFEKYKNRSNIHGVGITGESVSTETLENHYHILMN